MMTSAAVGSAIFLQQGMSLLQFELSIIPLSLSVFELLEPHPIIGPYGLLLVCRGICHQLLGVFKHDLFYPLFHCIQH